MGISLLSLVGEIYAGFQMNRFHRVIEGLTHDEQEGFKSGKETVDQIFAQKQLVGGGPKEKKTEFI